MSRKIITDADSERIKPATHGLKIGDTVGLKKEVWCLKPTATGKILQFGTEGHVAEVEWRREDRTERSKGQMIHNWLSVEFLEKQ